MFAGAVGDFWGSRGVSNLCKFQYHERPAIVQCNNRILAPAKYYIALGKDKIIESRLTSNDSKEVYIRFSNPSSEPYQRIMKNKSSVFIFYPEF